MSAAPESIKAARLPCESWKIASHKPIIESMKTDKIAALRQTVLFGSLAEEELSALAAHTVERRLVREEMLFMVGEEAHGLFIIVSGAVRAFRAGADGREQVLHTERAGATLGEVPVFDDGTYPATAVADEDSVVLFISKEDVRAVCLRHPQIALTALKLLAGRLRRHAELIEALSLREVKQRLSRFLLNEAKRCGARSDTGNSFELTMTHGQVAARIGTVREVVSRAMSRLQTDGFISLENRHIIILSEEGLKACAYKN